MRPPSAALAAALLAALTCAAARGAEPPAPPGTGAALTEADEQFGAAGGLFARGLFAQAAAGYAEFLKRFPADPRAAEAGFRMAESWYRALDFKRARAGFENSLDLKLPPDRQAAAWFRIGAILYAQNDAAGAAAALERADPDKLPAEARPAARYFLGAARLLLGKENEAAGDFAAAAGSSAPAVAAPALLALGRLSADKGAAEPAAARLEELLKKFPDSPEAPEAAFRLAELLRGAGKAKEAAALYERAAAGAPALASRAALGLGWARLELGAPDEAVRLASAAGKDPALRDESIFLTGAAHLAARRYPEALRFLGGVEAKGPRAEPAAARVVWGHFLSGDQTQAGMAARDFALKYPASRFLGEVRYVAGLAAAAAGDLKAALAALDAAAADPKSDYAAESAYRAALLAAKAGNAAEARDRLGRFVKAHPAHRLADPALIKLGEMCLAAGDAPAAARHFDAELAAFPASPWRPAAAFGRALAAAGAGDWDGFVARCGEVVQRWPGDPRAAEAGFWLAWNHERLKAYDAAAAAYEELIAKHKDSPLVYEFKFRLSAACYLNGNYPKAADGFLALARSGKRPVPAETLLWLGDWLGAQGRSAEAREVYNQAAASPEAAVRGEAALAAARLARREGRFEEAAGLYRRLLADPAQAERAEEAALGLAAALRLGGDPKAALAESAKLLLSKDERVRLAARGEAALAQLAAGDAEAARRELAVLVAMYDDPALLPGWLAALREACEKLGRKDEAAAFGRELVKRYPASPEAIKAAAALGLPLPKAPEPGEGF